MKVMIYVLADKETGLGHWYRMQALYQALFEAGHDLFLVTNALKQGDLSIRPLDPQAWGVAISTFKPDWAVVDIPGQPPEFMLDFENLCLIDGVGHSASKAKLVISQGAEGEYNAPDYLLLRPELEFAQGNRKDPAYDLVWGGAADPLNLLDKYRKLFGHGYYSPNTAISISRMIRETNGELLDKMAGAYRAVVSSGMILWELAYLRVPTYTFSRTKRHLATALYLQELGLVKAYPKVGIPSDKEFLVFVNRHFETWGDKIDLGGAGRVVKLMEEKL